MKLANIYPVANQELYKDESYVMILAHLLKYYKPENFNPNAYVIMDNGLYEEAQVSTSLEDIVQMAKKSGIHVNEIIVPDVLNECEANIKLFEENLPTIKAHPEMNFMFVLQSTTPAELKRAVDYINQYKDTVPNLAVGFSKLSPLDRMSDEIIDILKTCVYPIHVLGIMLSFAENEKLKTFVRGNDSSHLAYIVKNEATVPADPLHYVRYGRRADGRGTERDIELETDVLDSNKLRTFRDVIMPKLGYER